MNAIEDHGWVVDWTYANFPPPVHARKVKGLEYGVSCNAAISLILLIPNPIYFRQHLLFRLFQGGPWWKDTLGSAIQSLRKTLLDDTCILAWSKVLPFQPSTSNVSACNHCSVNCYKDD